MPRSKVAITIDKAVLARLDRLVRAAIFANRSQAIEQAITEKLERMELGRLATECAKLDPEFERALAEESISEELSEWPDH